MFVPVMWLSSVVVAVSGFDAAERRCCIEWNRYPVDDKVATLSAHPLIEYALLALLVPRQ